MVFFIAAAALLSGLLPWCSSLTGFFIAAAAHVLLSLHLAFGYNFVVFTRLFLCGGGLDFIFQSATLLLSSTLHVATDSGNTFSVRVQHKPNLTSLWSSSQFLVFFIAAAALFSGLLPWCSSLTGFLIAAAHVLLSLYLAFGCNFCCVHSFVLVRRSARLHLRPDLTPCQGPISDHGYV